MTNLLTKQQIIEKYQDYPSFQELYDNNPNDYQFVYVYGTYYDGPISGVVLYNGKLRFFFRTRDYHSYLSKDFETKNIYASVYTIYKIPKQILSITKKRIMIFHDMFGKNITHGKYGEFKNFPIEAWIDYRNIYSDLGIKSWNKECVTWKQIGKFKFDIVFVDEYPK